MCPGLGIQIFGFLVSEIKIPKGYPLDDLKLYFSNIVFDSLGVPSILTNCHPIETPLGILWFSSAAQVKSLGVLERDLFQIEN